MTTTTTPRAWRDQAACIGTPSDVHHPATTLDDHGNTPAYAEARTICRTCPVILTCLDDALTYEAANGWARTSRHGMYGGLTPGERYLLTEVVVAIFDSRPSAMSDDLWARLLAAAPKPVSVSGEPAAEEAALWT